MEVGAAPLGYLAVLVGAFLEGETVLVLSGFAVYRGYLELPGALAAALAGTVLADQGWFLLGRRRGAGALARRPRLRARMGRVQALVERHPFAVTVGFRFLYGIRTVAPFVLGTSRLPAWRFSLLDFASATVWASAGLLVGLLLGNAAEALVSDIRRWESAIFLGIALTGAAVWARHFARRAGDPALRP